MLKRVYVLSNDWAWALGEVRDALEEDGWSDVVSTADLQLDAEQSFVAMAVDMAIAERAEVFVGNGVRHSRGLFFFFFFLGAVLILPLLSSFRVYRPTWSCCDWPRGWTRRAIGSCRHADSTSGSLLQGFRLGTSYA